MNVSLSLCPACGAKVSTAASTCMQCSHPMRKPAAIKSQYLIIMLAILLVALAGLVFYKLNPSLLSSNNQKTQNKNAELVIQLPTSPLPSAEELNKQIIGYVLRINRLTPYKPNETVTLQRVRYLPAPMEVIYEYEMTIASRIEDLSYETLQDSIKRRYCTADDLMLFSQNRIPVTFAYYSAGHLKREITVSSC